MSGRRHGPPSGSMPPVDAGPETRRRRPGAGARGVGRTSTGVRSVLGHLRGPPACCGTFGLPRGAGRPAVFGLRSDVRARTGAGSKRRRPGADRDGPRRRLRCGLAWSSVRLRPASSSTSRLRVRFGSTGMPGPIVVRDRRLLDVAALGRRRLEPQDLVERGARSSRPAAARVNDALPMMKCRLACLSTRNSILPPLMSVDRLGDVHRDGAGLRVRHQATRTEHLAEAADLAHEVGGGDDGVEVGPARRRPSRCSSSEPTKSAPAARACSACSPVAKTRTRAVLPVPCGRLTVPRTIWSALRGSTPRPHGDLDGRVVLRGAGLLGQTHGLERGVELVRVDLLGGCAVGLAALHAAAPCCASCGVVVRRASAGPATGRCRGRPT